MKKALQQIVLLDNCKYRSVSNWKYPSNSNWNKVRDALLRPDILTTISKDTCSGVGYLDLQTSKFIGKGNQGHVHNIKCTCDANTHKIPCDMSVKHAIKVINKDDIASVKTEKKLLERFQSKHIVKFFGLHEVEHFEDFANKIIVDMEFAGVSLEKLMNLDLDANTFKRLETIVDLMPQALDILRLLKEKGVIHRDIKPANMCFEKHSNVLKLIDFGISFHKDNAKSFFEEKSFKGTPTYMSPESFGFIDEVKFPPGTDYSEKVESCFYIDEWGMAATFFHLIYKQFPFTGHNLPNLALNIMAKNLQMTEKEIHDGDKIVVSFRRECFEEFFHFFNNRTQEAPKNFENLMRKVGAKLQEAKKNYNNEIVENAYSAIQDIENIITSRNVSEHFEDVQKAVSNLKKLPKDEKSSGKDYKVLLDKLNALMIALPQIQAIIKVLNSQMNKKTQTLVSGTPTRQSSFQRKGL